MNSSTVIYYEESNRPYWRTLSRFSIWACMYPQSSCRSWSWHPSLVLRPLLNKFELVNWRNKSNEVYTKKILKILTTFHLFLNDFILAQWGNLPILRFLDLWLQKNLFQSFEFYNWRISRNNQKGVSGHKILFFMST